MKESIQEKSMEVAARDSSAPPTRGTSACSGGFPIDDEPCAFCGADVGDVCGKTSGETHKQGLEIVRLRAALRRALPLLEKHAHAFNHEYSACSVIRSALSRS